MPRFKYSNAIYQIVARGTVDGDTPRLTIGRRYRLGSSAPRGNLDLGITVRRRFTYFRVHQRWHGECIAGNLREFVDVTREALHVPANHPYALAEAILCCRKGGTASIPGVYTSKLNNVPMHAAMNKGLTLRMGLTHMQHYMNPLLDKVVVGEIDPSFIITRRGTLDDAPSLYETFDARR